MTETSTTPEETSLPTSEREWREKLTRMQYYVAREAGTERPFSGEYWNTKDPGTYMCIGCGAPLFRSNEKFDSGTGWPSFYDVVDGAPIKEHSDRSLGMVRTEVICSNCQCHLGHLSSRTDPGPRASGTASTRPRSTSSGTERERQGPTVAARQPGPTPTAVHLKRGPPIARLAVVNLGTEHHSNSRLICYYTDV